MGAEAIKIHCAIALLIVSTSSILQLKALHCDTLVIDNTRPSQKIEATIAIVPLFRMRDTQKRAVASASVLEISITSVRVHKYVRLSRARKFVQQSQLLPSLFQRWPPRKLGRLPRSMLRR